MTRKAKASIRWPHSNKWKPYPKELVQEVSNAVHPLSRFHTMWPMNQATGEVPADLARRREMGRLRTGPEARAVVPAITASGPDAGPDSVADRSTRGRNEVSAEPFVAGRRQAVGDLPPGASAICSVEAVIVTCGNRPALRASATSADATWGDVGKPLQHVGSTRHRDGLDPSCFWLQRAGRSRESTALRAATELVFLAAIAGTRCVTVGSRVRIGG